MDRSRRIVSLEKESFCYDGHCAPSIASPAQACITAEQMYVVICRTLMACLEPLAASLGMITVIRSPFQQQMRAATSPCSSPLLLSRQLFLHNIQP